MASTKITGTVTIEGITTKTTGTFKFAALYQFTGDMANMPGHSGFIFTFHRSENAAMRGTWATPAAKKAWKHIGYAAIQF